MLSFTKMPLAKVNDISPYMGCDPEFFFRFNGEIVGAEKFIPKDGLVLTTERLACTVNNAAPSKFIIDGVQAELNPRANACRANLANEIVACMKTLKNELAARGTGFTLDFSRTIEITKEKLMELDEASRKFGCAPSNSIYKQKGALKITEVDPTEYRVRAAGGHIHIGVDSGQKNLITALTKDHYRTVEMLDLLCGNTAVLIDRDAGNIERRKVYGRAGEFRLPKHGLEYRTLSNFWLTSYPLMSFAFGMARVAVQLMADPTYSEVYYKEFTSKVKAENIHKAINENDFDLAYDNFKSIEQLLLEVSGEHHRFAINSKNIKEFHYFVDSVKNKGLSHWFKDEPMTHWTSIGECHAGGFYDFLTQTVHKEMKEAEQPKVATAA